MPRSRQAPRSERPTRAFPYLQNAPPRSSGNRSGLGLVRRGRLACSSLASGRGLGGLFRPDPTSLSTSLNTGDRRTPNRKPDDNARAKCGTGECRQDQNHDLTVRKQEPSNASSSAARHEMPIRRFKLGVANCDLQDLPCSCWHGPCSAATGQICRAAGLEQRTRPPSVFPSGRCNAEAAMKYESGANSA